MQTVIDFEKFVTDLRVRLSGPLPGVKAHEPMRAHPAGSIRPAFNHRLPPRPGSVLILLYPADNSIRFPLTLRPDYAGTHGGQVSFPGGKAERGESHVETALRECEEEIGVPRTMIEVIGQLSDFFVIPSNFMVTPVVGVIPRRPAFVADRTEVVKIIEGDWRVLVREDAVREKEILAAKRFPMIAPHFEIEGEVIWGATAMMLNELRWVLREIKVF
jgi:8-oxo-dGTP pyrophosphatase MutT (NUDIX family)